MPTTTIEDIYAAINPLPAMLSAKGAICPDVQVNINANADIDVVFFLPRSAERLFDRDCKVFSGDVFGTAIDQAIAFIGAMPSAEQAKLNRFMGALGSVIDDARIDGIDVEFLNPLVATMKRLSENAITFQAAE